MHSPIYTEQRYEEAGHLSEGPYVKKTPFLCGSRNYLPATFCKN